MSTKGDWLSYSERGGISAHQHQPETSLLRCIKVKLFSSYCLVLTALFVENDR